MKRDQHSSEPQRCKHVQQEDDINHEVADLLRQLEPGQSYDDLHKRQQGK